MDSNKQSAEFERHVETVQMRGQVREAYYDGDYFTAVIKTTAMIEYLIEYYMSKAFVVQGVFFPENPEEERIALSWQLKLATSLGMIPQWLEKTLKAVANLRNRYAHRIRYELQRKDVLDVVKKYIRYSKDANEALFVGDLNEWDELPEENFYDSYFTFTMNLLDSLLMCGIKFESRQDNLRELESIYLTTSLADKILLSSKQRQNDK